LPDLTFAGANNPLTNGVNTFTTLAQNSAGATGSNTLTVKQEIAIALEELTVYYPDWRFGQMVANVASWAAGPKIESIWDVEDKPFLEALQKHLEKKRSADNQS
jgi:hypothetical protein